MNIFLAAPSQSREAIVSPDALFAARSTSPTPGIANDAPNSISVDDETSHMRRRLFRTLDDPGRSLLVIDCGSVPVDQIREVTERFFDDREFRASNNLVLAIPTESSFADSPAYDFVQSVKQSAFENRLDGKVSWLLIHHRDSELPALAELVQQQGGRWHAS